MQFKNAINCGLPHSVFICNCVDFEYQHSQFLAFETEAIADEFLKINIDELRIAKDFV
jgi:hypothetical protein